MKKILVALLTLSLIILSGCSSSSSSNQKPKLTVACKNFTEQYILAQIMGQLLQSKGYDVKIDEGSYGNTALLNQALKDGNIDVFPEYTGTGYMLVLKNKLLPTDTPDSVYQKTKEGYDKQLGFAMLDPFGFNDTYTLVISRKKAQELNIKTFSDLVKYSKDLTIGMDSTFYSRPDGYQGLVQTYGFQFKAHQDMDVSMLFSAMAAGKADVIVAYSTDGQIPATKSMSLEDDKHYFPPYYACPVITNKMLKEHPDVAQVLNLLAGKMNNQIMSEMTAKVDVDKQDTQTVAHDFLVQIGLIK